MMNHSLRAATVRERLSENHSLTVAARKVLLAWLLIARVGPLFFQGVGQPAVIAGPVPVDVEETVHLVMAPAAQLGAGQLPDLVPAVAVPGVDPAAVLPLAVVVGRLEPDGNVV